MKFNIVLNDRGWVMEELANHLQKYMTDVSISNNINRDAQYNLYFNWHAFKQPTNTIDVCLFTHLESGQDRHWQSTMSLCNVALLFGKNYKDFYDESIFPYINKAVPFYPPAFEHFLPQKKVEILVVGREYYSERKNSNWIHDIDNLGLNITFTNGKFNKYELVQAYKDCDYVLVMSNNESGPMCVREAIAMNKPVIAPNVGWCWDFPCIKYNDKNSLIRLLDSLVVKNDCWGSFCKKLEHELEYYGKA